MKITICGSIAFYDEMQEVKTELESLGYEVKLPPNEIKDENGEMISVKEYYERRKREQDDSSWMWDRKKEAIMAHFEKIEWSDEVLVLNHDKNGIEGYIGGNTLMEIGLALWLGKKIFLYNKIPDIGYKEEILGSKPILIDGDLNRIS